MRCVGWTQNLYWVRIERHDNGGAAGFLRMPRRSANDSLVTEVNAVENADRQEEGAVKSRKIGGGTKNVHENDE